MIFRDDTSLIIKENTHTHIQWKFEDKDTLLDGIGFGLIKGTLVEHLYPQYIHILYSLCGKKIFSFTLLIVGEGCVCGRHHC